MPHGAERPHDAIACRETARCHLVERIHATPLSAEGLRNATAWRDRATPRRAEEPCDATWCKGIARCYVIRRKSPILTQPTCIWCPHTGCPVKISQRSLASANSYLCSQGRYSTFASTPDTCPPVTNARRGRRTRQLISGRGGCASGQMSTSVSQQQQQQ